MKTTSEEILFKSKCPNDRPSYIQNIIFLIVLMLFLEYVLIFTEPHQNHGMYSLVEPWNKIFGIIFFLGFIMILYPKILTLFKLDEFWISHQNFYIKKREMITKIPLQSILIQVKTSRMNYMDQPEFITFYKEAENEKKILLFECALGDIDPEKNGDFISVLSKLSAKSVNDFHCEWAVPERLMKYECISSSPTSRAL